MSDLIKRQDAIDATWKEPSYSDPLNVLTEVRDRIKKLPSANQWIPVSERLPEEYKAVLAYSAKFNNIWAVSLHRDGHWYIWHPYRNDKYEELVYGELIAWMPLPEPYQYPLDIRDCDHCKHYVTRDGQTGCEKWECEFEKEE